MASKGIEASLTRALTDSTPENWLKVANAWADSLTRQERAALCWAAFMAMDRRDRDLVDFHCTGLRAPPESAWTGTMAEARRWAASAHELYRKAVIVAAYDEMRPENRTAFLAYAEMREGA